jgi:hypothetical protein
MINELKDYLNKGGEKVFTRYSVEIGDALWEALYSHVEGTYGIESVCEDGEQKFAVLTADDKYYRLDFSVNEEGVVEFAAEAVEITDYTPEAEPQFSADAVAEYASKKKKKKDDEEEEKPEDGEEKPAEEEKKDDEDKKPEDKSDNSDDKEDDEDEDEEKKKKKGKKSKYNLEEVQEYVELSTQYSALQTDYSNAQSKIADLEAQITELTKFKQGVEKKEKEAMIASFYMLSDKDKEDVVANIDTYSLDDIEAKLSILCVRNKVSFNLDDDKPEDAPTTYHLGGEGSDDGVPAWVKAIRAVASEM